MSPNRIFLYLQKRTIPYLYIKSFYFAILLLCYCSVSSSSAQTTITPHDTTEIINTINAGVRLKGRNHDSALILLFQAYQKSKLLKYKDGMGRTFFEIGLIYTSLNKSDSAIYYNTRAIPLLVNSQKSTSLVPALYSNIGYSYYMTGNYTHAILYYDSAVKEGYRIGLPKGRRHLAITLNNLAGVLLQTKQSQKALIILNQAEEISRKGNFREELAMTMGNKASVYTRMNKNEKAEIYFANAIELFHQLDNNSLSLQINLISTLCDFAELKLKQNQPKAALKILDETKNPDSKDYYKNYSSIAPAYIKGCAYLQLKDYSLAEKFLNQSLEESKLYNLKDYRIKIHKALSAVYDSSKQYPKALLHFHQYEQLKDSLLSTEKVRDINEIDAKYRTAEKDRDIAQKELLISKQQAQLTKHNFWIIGISLSTLLLASLFLLRNRINRQKQDSQEKQIRILTQQHKLHLREQEIDHLNAMIKGEEQERIRIAGELHDGIVSQLLAVRLHLNGTLENKKGKELNPEDFRNSIQYLDEATKELRATAHNLMPETVLQNNLTISVQSYCSKMKDLSGIDIEFQAIGDPPPLHQDKALSIFRIVQELIQNAFKHAKASHIFVLLIYRDNVLTLTVEDNGEGYSVQQTDKTKGMGLKNILTRVKALQGEIDISSELGKGTSIHIEMEA